ncbi:hypothetical protein ACJX0J_010461, partial [Zea mays]
MSRNLLLNLQQQVAIYVYQILIIKKKRKHLAISSLKLPRIHTTHVSTSMYGGGGGGGAGRGIALGSIQIIYEIKDEKETQNICTALLA